MPTTSNIDNTAPLTYTSALIRTRVYTITSCPDTVTECPVGSVTTEISTSYTTWCPSRSPSAATKTRDQCFGKSDCLQRTGSTPGSVRPTSSQDHYSGLSGTQTPDGQSPPLSIDGIQSTTSWEQPSFFSNMVPTSSQNRPAAESVVQGVSSDSQAPSMDVPQPTGTQNPPQSDESLLPTSHQSESPIMTGSATELLRVSGSFIIVLTFAIAGW